jgi:hypothetical protein
MSGSRGGFSVTIGAVDTASAKIDQINRRIASMRAPVDRVSKGIAKFGDTTGITALGKGMRDVAQQSLLAFENITRMVGPLGAITGAASIAGMARLAGEWASFGTNLGFAARRSRISTRELQGLEGAARLAGSSAAALDSGILSLNDNLIKSAAGRAPDATVAFQGLGISVRDAGGHIRTAASVLPELAAKLQGVTDPTTKMEYLTRIFGGSA